MATKPTARTPAIEPGAYYTLTVSRGFVFERTRFGPLGSAEIGGAALIRLLAGDQADAVVGGDRKV